MAQRGLGRDQVHDAAWKGAYPHPFLSCLMPFTAVLALVAVAMGAVWFWQRSLPKDTTVPSVVGLALSVAEEELRRAGLRCETLEQAVPDETIPVGAVISALPESGRRVKVGRVVRLLISSGSAYTTVPDVRELSQAVARERLSAVQLIIAKEEYVNNTVIPFDRVISLTPQPGTRVKRFSSVNLVLSKGDAEEITPNVSDLRSSVLSVALPTDTDDPAEVRIDVTDDTGTRTVLRDVRNPGETVIETVQGTGEMTVNVYFGPRLILTRTL